MAQSQTSQYKAYKLRDFKNMQEQTTHLKMGGLGANIGSDVWERAKRKKEAAQKYAEVVRMTAANNT